MLLNHGHYLGASPLVNCSNVDFTASLARSDVDITPFYVIVLFTERTNR